MLPPVPGDTLVITFSSSGHRSETKYLPVPANSQDFLTVRLEAVTTATVDGNKEWYDIFFSTLKEQAWNALVKVISVVNQQFPIGWNTTWTFSKDFSFNGFNVTFTLDIDLIRSGEYEITINIDSGANFDRRGTTILISAPGKSFDYLIRIGGKFRLVDPDNDIYTVNSKIYLDSLDITTAKVYELIGILRRPLNCSPRTLILVKNSSNSKLK